MNQFMATSNIRPPTSIIIIIIYEIQKRIEKKERERKNNNKMSKIDSCVRLTIYWLSKLKAQ